MLKTVKTVITHFFLVLTHDLSLCCVWLEYHSEWSDIVVSEHERNNESQLYLI